MGFQNQSLAAQTLTDAGTITLAVSDNLESEFEGTVLFTATGTKATGTFSASAQLQGSADGTNFVNLGSAVVMADTVESAIPLSGSLLLYTNYRVLITGAGTQSTSIVGTYTRKSRD